MWPLRGRSKKQEKIDMNPVRTVRQFVASLRREPGMPYAEFPFRPITCVRYQDVA